MEPYRTTLKTKRWVRHVARVGYFAIGVVYVFVAVLDGMQKLREIDRSQAHCAGA